MGSSSISADFKKQDNLSLKLWEIVPSDNIPPMHIIPPIHITYPQLLNSNKDAAVLWQVYILGSSWAFQKCDYYILSGINER